MAPPPRVLVLTAAITFPVLVVALVLVVRELRNLRRNDVRRFITTIKRKGS